MSFLRSLFLVTIVLLLSIRPALSKEKPVETDTTCFCHPVAGTCFPYRFDNFCRIQTQTDKVDIDNISVSYHAGSTKKGVSLTVFVYPASEAFEKRFGNEYLSTLQRAVDFRGTGSNFEQHIYRVSKDGYNMPGMCASFKRGRVKSTILLFECGKYFIRYKIDSEHMDSLATAMFLEKVTGLFSPVDIVKKVPVVQTTTLIIAPGATSDTIILDAVIMAGLTKLKWVAENVDSLERCSGFPSLYMEEQTEALLAMVNMWDTTKHEIDPVKEWDMIELKLIRDSGFLNEYVFEQYHGLLVVPDSIRLDLNGYYRWKEKHDIHVATGTYLKYIVGYAEGETEGN